MGKWALGGVVMCFHDERKSIGLSLLEFKEAAWEGERALRQI